MKVKELIIRLKELDPEAYVMEYNEEFVMHLDFIDTGTLVKSIHEFNGDFKSDNVTDDEYYDGCDKDLYDVLHKVVLLS